MRRMPCQIRWNVRAPSTQVTAPRAILRPLIVESETWLTSPDCTRRAFTLLNDLRRSRHSAGSASSRNDTLSPPHSRARSSTADNADLSALKSRAVDATCPSTLRQSTHMSKATILAFFSVYTVTRRGTISPNSSVALLSLRFSAAFKNCRR